MNKKNTLPTIRHIRGLKGKRVLVRIDANVPLEHGQVIDRTRLQAVLPTLLYLQKKGATVLILSHLGRPEGKVVPALSLKPVAEALAGLLKKPVSFIPCDWSLSSQDKQLCKDAVMNARPGDILFFENTRFSSLEEKKGKTLAVFMTSLGDLFVNDGFAVSHRPDVSVAVLPTYIPSYAGLLLEKEIAGLERLIKGKERPFVALVGGIKLETKIPLLQSLQKTSDAILLGGGIANTCLAALGYGVGKSIIDSTLLPIAKKIARNKKVMLPVDVIVGKADGSGARVVFVPPNPSELAVGEESIFDIGPKTIEAYEALLREGKRVLWNGAMGLFEKTAYAAGTMTLARFLGKKRKKQQYIVAGGGETIAAIAAVQSKQGFTVCSTGGGAMLSFVAGEILPGVEVLHKRKKAK